MAAFQATEVSRMWRAAVSSMRCWLVLPGVELGRQAADGSRDRNLSEPHHDHGPGKHEAVLDATS